MRYAWPHRPRPDKPINNFNDCVFFPCLRVLTRSHFSRDLEALFLRLCCDWMRFSMTYCVSIRWTLIKFLGIPHSVNNNISLFVFGTDAAMHNSLPVSRVASSLLVEISRETDTCMGFTFTRNVYSLMDVTAKSCILLLVFENTGRDTLLTQSWGSVLTAWVTRGGSWWSREYTVRRCTERQANTGYDFVARIGLQGTITAESYITPCLEMSLQLVVSWELCSCKDVIHFL